ncbi:MAG: hypothetical protein OER56_16850, partial [Hyphomicrobiales bacterium]|nr:hypothetical protein [Hyphomicrobiales bacterium]
IVCLQAGPHNQTLRARHICLLSALGRLENHWVSGACLPSQPANLPAQNGMDLLSTDPSSGGGRLPRAETRTVANKGVNEALKRWIAGLSGISKLSKNLPNLFAEFFLSPPIISPKNEWWKCYENLFEIGFVRFVVGLFEC